MAPGRSKHLYLKILVGIPESLVKRELNISLDGMKLFNMPSKLWSRFLIYTKNTLPVGPSIAEGLINMEVVVMQQNLYEAMKIKPSQSRNKLVFIFISQSG